MPKPATIGIVTVFPGHAASGRIRSMTARHLLPGLIALCLHLPALANELVSSTVEQYLKAQTQGLPGKTSFSVGKLDPRTQLSACSAMEPFLPAGTRLWGKANVGVRCLGPANWTVYVPVQISVSGNYIVSVRPLAAGQPLVSADFAVRQGDLTLLPPGVVTDPAQAAGKSLRHSIGSGQPVRGDMLLAPLVIQQGQTVRLVSQGPGFAVSNEGRALSNAAEGQIAQARTASGQVVSGVARPGGIIEISP